ncbi:MAG: YdeI/OmpD-associated family protein [Thermomicrobiales bacterium]
MAESGAGVRHQMGIEDGIQFDDAVTFDRWLDEHGQHERRLWAVIYKKSSQKQTVTFDALLEVALTRGWVDVQTKGTDEERYGIRFVARKPGSNWSATNRKIVKRLIADGRMHEAGAARLPPDLFADE